MRDVHLDESEAIQTEFDSLYRERQFDEANRRLSELDVGVMNAYQVVSYLVVARWPEYVEGIILPCRLGLIERSIIRLRELGRPEAEIEKMIKGLRPQSE